jgi:GMP synthase-like glutamine amidotransferase
MNCQEVRIGYLLYLQPGTICASMRKLLVFQHSAREPLGVFDPMLRRAGFRIRYVNFSRQPDLKPDVSRYNGLVVLGGPMNVDQAEQHPHLTTEIEAIRVALDRGIPVLGICLGAQLLAAALGAHVRPNNVREIGWYPLHPTAEAGKDPLCRHLGEHSMCSSGMPIPSICRPAPCTWPALPPAPTRHSVSVTAPMVCSSTWKRIRI